MSAFWLNALVLLLLPASLASIDEDSNDEGMAVVRHCLVEDPCGSWAGWMKRVGS